MSIQLFLQAFYKYLVEQRRHQIAQVKSQERLIEFVGSLLTNPPQDDIGNDDIQNVVKSKQ
ncbi:MAG: hypothetical protein WC998_01470 [Candidatus Paceibacterota bacterium]|jgi:hypothetical protein